MKTSNFLGQNKEFDESTYVILGVPIDETCTYRPGSRFGPLAIREASQNLESYSLRTRKDVEDAEVFDVGDMILNGTIEESLDRLQHVVGEVLASKKILVSLGGEHTITYGCVKSLKDVAILSFDAHLDMRDEYLGRRLSHATFMRRIAEFIGSDRIMEIGIRAICNEEVAFAEKANVEYITAPEAMRNNRTELTGRIHDFLSKFNRFYLTIDVDVLDPSYAPAVGNPVPEGLSPTVLLDLVQAACEHELIGFDVVEVTPHYDYGITALQAAHIIFNILAFLEKKRM
ncbi:MAG: Agmatinase [Thermoproteota archaeon]|nr:Agmatinase [Thermoproteota archaeon]